MEDYGSIDLCTDIAMRIKPKEFKDWVSNAYELYDLEEAQREMTMKFKKESLVLRPHAVICDYLSQFPIVKNAFIEDHLHILEQEEEKPKKRKESPDLIPETLLIPENLEQSKKQRRVLRPKFSIPILSQTDMEIRSKCMNLAILENFVNSCYMDSVLMILYTVLEEFTLKVRAFSPEFLITQYIIEPREPDGKEKQLDGKKGVCNRDPKLDVSIRKSIQQAFADLHTILSGTGKKDKCSDFRRLLEKCENSGYETFFVPKEKEDTMRDADEFLRFVFEIFEINTSTRHISNSRRIRETREIEEGDSYVLQGQSPVWEILSSELGRSHTVKDYLTIESVQDANFGQVIDGKSMYDQIITTRTLYDTPMAVINVQRKSLIRNEPGMSARRLMSMSNQKFNATPISPSMKLVLGSGRTLHLVATILYDPAKRHYTAIFRCGNEWYHYNDIPDKGKHINLYANNYSDFLGSNDQLVRKYGVLHFYVDEAMLPKNE